MILKYEWYDVITSILIICKSQDLLFLIAPKPFNSSGKFNDDDEGSPRWR